MKTSEGFNLISEPAKLKSISIGYSDSDFLIAFNCDDNNTPEYACVIPANKLKDIVGLLFSAGVDFEKEKDSHIGFNIEE